MGIEIFKLEQGSLQWRLEAKTEIPASVIDQFRAHSLVASVFYNPFTNRFFATLFAYTQEKAEYARDWILEDVIFPDEQFTCDWDDELDAILYSANFDWDLWLAPDDNTPHSTTGTLGWLDDFSSDDDEDFGSNAA